MERCPNCGATVREGARFCTACGFRMVAPHDERPADAVAARDQNSWWAPPSEDAVPAADEMQLASPAAPAPADETPPGGGSFWDRIEEATQEQEHRPAEPQQQWAAAANATPSTKPQEGEAAAEASDSTSTMIFTPASSPEGPDEAASESDPDEAVAVAAGEDEIERAAPVAASHGLALISELQQVCRRLDAARAQEDAALATRLDELQTAIQEARERPREIDVMLAISARLETIDALIASNQRMTSAIDEALRSLEGTDID